MSSNSIALIPVGQSMPIEFNTLNLKVKNDVRIYLYFNKCIHLMSRLSSILA